MRKLLVVVVVLVLLVAGAAAFLVLRNEDAPDPVALSSDPTGSSTTTAAPDAGAGATADGEWTVVPGERTFLGYRVNEEFASIPNPAEAVGRTPSVTGAMTVAGAEVPAATVNGDLSALTSDEERRDNRIRSDGLETDRFPEATFTLTSPIDLGGAPEEGVDVTATAAGDLTLHGVTRAVEIELDARWTGEEIEVVGDLPIVFADYQIDPPNIAGFVTVEDEGVMELSLLFNRA